MARRLNEVNYLVLTLCDLAGSNADPISSATLKAGVSQVFAGSPINFSRALRDLVSLSLAVNTGSSVAPTRFGIKFASYNKTRIFEVKEEQLRLLQESVHMTQLGEEIRANDSNQGGFGDSHLLLKEIFPKDEIEQRKRRLAEKVHLRHREGISEEELENQLHEKRIYGLRAEEFVVDFEIARLRRAGMNREIGLVRRVSQGDVTKGYDIESFTNAGNNPDRFIEVKCSKNPFLSFFWSKNEVDVAKQLGEKYFIYFVWMDEDGEPEGSPEIIANPAITVLENPSKYNVSIGTIVVREL